MAKFRFLKLPGCYNFESKLTRPRKVKQLQKLLGTTFYPRISNIYTNIIQAIANQKNAYLASALSDSLSKEIIKKRNQLNQNGYRIKISQFQTKGVPLGNISSHTWLRPGTSISVQSKVYFGQKFDPSKPDDRQFTTINTGPSRSFVFYKGQSIVNCLKNFYNHQTYQFKVQIESCDVLQVFDSMNKPIFLQQGKSQEQLRSKNIKKKLVTEMILKTGNSQFDWVVTDLNNMMKDQIDKDVYLNKKE